MAGFKITEPLVPARGLAKAATAACRLFPHMPGHQFGGLERAEPREPA
jgi:hypothetical protein